MTREKEKELLKYLLSSPPMDVYNEDNMDIQESNLELISNFGYATLVKNRLEVYKYLKSKNIQTRPLICGNMGQQPFLNSKKIIKKDLIFAKFIDKNGIYLPNHANLSLNDVEYISDHLNHVAEPIFFKDI